MTPEHVIQLGEDLRDRCDSKEMTKMDELLQSVYDNPELWRSDDHCFRRGRFALWVYGGRMCCRPSIGVSSEIFTVLDRRRWWKAYKWWCKNAPAAQLTGEQGGEQSDG